MLRIRSNWQQLTGESEREGRPGHMGFSILGATYPEEKEGGKMGKGEY